MFLAIGLLTFAACDGDDDDNGPVEQAIVLKSIQLTGTTTEAATVTVDQRDDEDGSADTNWTATFTLDDRVGPPYLPLDDGSARTHTFDVKSAPTGAGEVGRTRVEIAVGE
jgi:hypothetical protein